MVDTNSDRNRKVIESDHGVARTMEAKDRYVVFLTTATQM